MKIKNKVESSPIILADSFNSFFMTISENIGKKLFIQIQITRIT